LEALSSVVILLLIVAAVLDWPVAIILVRTSRHAPSVRALRERALVAVGITILTNAFLLTVLNTEIGNVFWSQDTGRIVVRLLIGGIGLVPQLYWLLLFVTGGFSDQ
jgi:hypothetical protein